VDACVFLQFCQDIFRLTVAGNNVQNRSVGLAVPAGQCVCVAFQDSIITNINLHFDNQVKGTVVIDGLHVLDRLDTEAADERIHVLRPPVVFQGVSIDIFAGKEIDFGNRIFYRFLLVSSVGCILLFPRKS
jgi:hypothetical protein